MKQYFKVICATQELASLECMTRFNIRIIRRKMLFVQNTYLWKFAHRETTFWDKVGINTHYSYMFLLNHPNRIKPKINVFLLIIFYYSFIIITNFNVYTRIRSTSNFESWIE